MRIVSKIGKLILYTHFCDLSFLHFKMHVMLIKHLTNSSRETLKFIAHCLWGGSEREGLPAASSWICPFGSFSLARLSVSLAPQSVLLRYIHCHVLLLTTFRDGKCLVSSYCQRSINYAILPFCYPLFPIFSHFEGQIPFYIWRGSWGLSFVKIFFLSTSILWHKYQSGTHLLSLFLGTIFRNRKYLRTFFLPWFIPLCRWWQWCW